MDWKIPATIMILAVIVGLGLLPLLSSDFNINVGNYFSFVDNLGSSNMNFEENVALSMTVEEFPQISASVSPVKVMLSSSSIYTLLVDGKTMNLTGPITIENFKGTINIINGSLNGKADRLTSQNFDLSGSTSVSLNSQKLEEMKVSDLKMTQIGVNKGTLKTTKPQNMEATIQSGANIYGFKGSVDNINGTIYISGTGSMIKTNGLTIGIEQIK